MAGVFDLFSDDPGQAANMMLAAGLLSGRGSFNQILGNSLAQAQGTYGSVKDQALRRQLEQEKLNQERYKMEQERARPDRIKQALQTFPQAAIAQGPPDGNQYPTVEPSSKDYMQWALNAYGTDPQLAQFGFRAADSINAREERAQSQSAAQQASIAAQAEKQKADLIARQERQAADLAARQNIADQSNETRKFIAGLMASVQREKTANKPAIPPAALKMQQEELDAIGTAASINQDLDAVSKKIEAGSLQLGPAKNLVGTAQNYLGMSTESSRNLATFKATLEKLRNDSLRLNRGVQTEGDAVRAWNELMTNINDPALVKQRLSEVQNINNRAMVLRKNNIDVLRANFGAEPLDVTPYQKVPSAIDGKTQDGWSIKRK